MSAGGPQLSMRDAEKLAAFDSLCQGCNHWLSDHHELQPMGALETFAAVLACTEHFRDPLTGAESFCDCVIDLEVDPGA